MDVKRPYDRRGRQAQAGARRRAVVAAARDLFERDGFRQTTVAGIAAAAGVSAESIYKNFGTKANVAKAVFDLVVAGDDEPVRVADRPEAQAVRDAPDLVSTISLFVDGLAGRQARSARVQALIRDGRHVDEALAPVWESLRAEALTGATLLARHLHARRFLRSDVDATEARDVLWTYLEIDAYEHLVLGRGWSLDRYGRWLTRTLVHALGP